MIKPSLFLLALSLTSCSVNPNADFDRHSMSWLIVPPTGDTMVFQAQTSPTYPSNTPEGEAVRRDWISAWLERRNLCLNGYTITDGPRPFRFDEDNPHRAQLRYELQCAGGTQ